MREGQQKRFREFESPILRGLSGRWPSDRGRWKVRGGRPHRLSIGGVANISSYEVRLGHA